MKTSLGLLRSLPLALAGLAVLGSCDTSKQGVDAAANASSSATSPAGTSAPRRSSGLPTMQKNGINLTPFDDSPKYTEAQLRLTSPPPGATQPSGAVPFSYELTNFRLTQMTGSEHAAQMANSMKGQHIHNIVDNQPYSAHYETKFSKPIADGQHVVLSFLSRSYHESLKHRGAYDLRVVNVGQAPPTPLNVDLRAPHLFYSRPKDTYTGPAETQRVMLDFYLVNTTLEPGGNNVRATINGTEFMLDRWLPYMMEGLPIGQNTVKLELVDSSGTLIPGPFNSVTRTFTLQP
ncbi:hypothetical protein [uncultured Hymenobacter sp.]|uniref:hypothetical protein n=1 Tax=uncultured Hymenobacter sp. TaxID=170016 RepID=UPI0035CB47B4